MFYSKDEQKILREIFIPSSLAHAAEELEEKEMSEKQP
jgi:hypothetical protein